MKRLPGNGPRLAFSTGRPLVFLPLLAGLVLAGALAACSSQESVPTFTVEPKPFHQRVTAEGLLKAAQVTPLSVPAEVRRSVRLAWLAADGQRVAQGEVVARFDAKEMEDLLEEGRSELTSADLSVNKEHIESVGKVLEHETALELATLELEHAQGFQKSDTGVFSRHDIIEDEIDEELALERRSHATASRGTQESLNRTQLDLLEIRRRQAQLKIERAEDALEALEMKAPHAGILTLARDWNGEMLEVGGQMWRGQKLGEIPDLGKMEAEVYVLEADAGGLAVGKPAEVVLEAHPETVYQGQVQRVDAVAKPRFRGSPVQYFGVTIEIEHTDPKVMKPGQRLRATLLLHEMENALVVPRQAVFQDGGRTRVYVRHQGRFASRAVTLGATSIGLLVVTEGLEAGDVIALRPPADRQEESDGPEDLLAAEGEPVAEH